MQPEIPTGEFSVGHAQKSLLCRNCLISDYKEETDQDMCVAGNEIIRNYSFLFFEY